MRYAIISDIHSNLEAIVSVLETIAKLDVKKTICLGDIIGYNANPNECISLVRSHGVKCVMGNHDERAAGLADTSNFNQQAEAALLWTRTVITDEGKEFLQNLPKFHKEGRSFLAVHGSINSLDDYIQCARDAARNFMLLGEFEGFNVCFFGHTHISMAYLSVEGSVLLNMDNSIKVEKGIKYLVNPGSVGQPRNRDPRASFVVYDTAERLITYHKVEYDIQTAAGKIIAAGLPERLAERLRLGW
ncbi:MAG: metallophosphoesterase family protein [Deltaproteobacteria bacterium]|nr:metallophosphoesterase family protein [Deltaproteobacteria bacterium]